MEIKKDNTLKPEVIFYLQQLLCEQKELLDNYIKENIELLINTEDNWDRKQLNEVTKIISRKKGYLSDEMCVSYIPITSVKDGSIIERLFTKVADKKDHKIALYGDILICRIADSLKIGRYAIVDYAENNCALVSPEFLILSSNDCILPEWILLFIEKNEIIGKICEVTRGAAIQRINDEYLMKLNIPCPPIEIQKKILLHIHGKKAAYLLKRNQIKFLNELISYILRNYQSLVNSESNIFYTLKSHLVQSKDFLNF